MKLLRDIHWKKNQMTYEEWRGRWFFIIIVVVLLLIITLLLIFYRMDPDVSRELFELIFLYQ